MFNTVLAAILLVAAQTAAPDPAAPDAETEESAEEALEAAEEAVDAAAEAVEQSAEAAEEAAEQEDEEAMVCRRQSYYDDFGRQRSHKSCRPRDDG